MLYSLDQNKETNKVFIKSTEAHLQQMASGEISKHLLVSTVQNMQLS